MSKVASIESLYEIFKTLKESFEGTVMDKGIKLVARLSEICYKFSGLSTVVSNISQLKDEFVSHFDFKKNEFWAAYTLRSLPQQFDQLRIVIKTKDNLTLDSLKTFLSQEPMREQQTTATLAKMNTKQNDFCIICGRNNHRTDDCRLEKTEPVTISNNKKGKKQNKEEDDKSKSGGQLNNRAINANLVVRQKCKLNYISNPNASNPIIMSYPHPTWWKKLGNTSRHSTWVS